VPSLIEDQTVEVRGERGGTEGHDAAVRMAVDVDRSAGLIGHRVHDRGDIFELALQCVVG
jgi:hypothetical protein